MLTRRKILRKSITGRAHKPFRTGASGRVTPFSSSFFAYTKSKGPRLIDWLLD